MNLDELKTELHRLNCHIEAAVNDGNRAMLLRCRLEAERARLLLTDTVVRERAVVEEPLPRPAPKANGNGSYPVTAAPKEESNDWHEYVPRRQQKRKPDGTPPTSEMICSALRDGGRVKMTVPGIRSYIAQHWWPNVRSADIYGVIPRLLQNGRLEKRGISYRLPNGHAD